MSGSGALHPRPSTPLPYLGAENEKLILELDRRFGEVTADAAINYLDKRLMSRYPGEGPVTVDSLVGHLRRFLRTTRFAEIEKFIIGYYGGSADTEIRYG